MQLQELSCQSGEDLKTGRTNGEFRPDFQKPVERPRSGKGSQNLDKEDELHEKSQ